MNIRAFFYTITAVFFLIPAVTCAQETDGKFLRITEDGQGTANSFQSAIVSFEKAEKKGKPITVDLISAVHVGEKSYYDALNQLFREYDAVLYELISPHGVIPEKGQEAKGVVSTIQNALKNVLQLEFQLDHIDYKQPNFIHADLTPEEFMASFGERGDSFSKMLIRILLSSQAQQSSAEGVDGQLGLIAALISNENSEDRAFALRRQLVKDFYKLESVVSGIEGSKGSGVVAARNERAFEVLRDTLRQGKRKIAIFYGAAHMPDLSKRLKRIGFVEKDTKWLVAWKLERS